MIAIIDYGVGNLGNLERALRASGGEPRTLSSFLSPHEVKEHGIRALVLPGVGNFGHCARRLGVAGFDELIRQTDLPVLGICVGMQLFYEGSDESDEPGLGLIVGRVRKLPQPHVGWEHVAGFGHMYFTHHYGETWVVRQRNLTGMQFHPEKSGAMGLRALASFVQSV